MEDNAIALIKEYLPSEWVIRQYNPDYGIDLAIDIFDYVDEEKQVAEARGEMFFVQVKSVNKTKIDTIRVCHQFTNPDGTIETDCEDIEVIKYSIDRDLLLTVESMGVGVPVLLFIVCLDTRRIFYVCLNDLIEKVIVPSEWDYADKQGTKQIYIPVRNEITRHPKSHLPLRIYAQRMKIYAAFLKFLSQQSELEFFHETAYDDPYDRTHSDYVKTLEYLRKAAHYIQVIKRYDVWQYPWGMWKGLHAKLLDLEQRINHAIAIIDNTPETKINEIPEMIPDFQFAPPRLITDIQLFWNSLVAWASTYETIGRENYLPTYFGHLLDTR